MKRGTWTSKDFSPPPLGGAHVQVTGILVVLVETANFGLTNSLRGRHRLVYLIVPPQGEHVREEKRPPLLFQAISPLTWGTERQHFYPFCYRLGLCVRKLFLKNNKCRHGPWTTPSNWSPDSSLGVQLDLPQVDLKSVNRTKDFFWKSRVQ